MKKDKTDYTKIWTDKFKFLIGCKIIKVDYMSNEEAEDFGWSDRPIQIHLDSGAILSPQADDEGNDEWSIEIDDSLDEAEENDLKERSWNKDVQ